MCENNCDCEYCKDLNADCKKCLTEEPKEHFVLNPNKEYLITVDMDDSVNLVAGNAVIDFINTQFKLNENLQFGDIGVFELKDISDKFLVIPKKVCLR